MKGGEHVTKKSLVAHVAEKAGLTKKQAAAAVDSILNGITGTLKRGDKVSLVGFGTFSVKHRAARVGVDPKTGARRNYPAKKVPHFKAGKNLKDKVL
jgi:DNA-binding protein HU-beta